ncbi:DM13 domain-containing protein [Ferrimonas marina]|uniref:Electron transfer DM13 n=1 Tax=Ferrimonas marina TaxID=299255 RepID=A0A1M5Y2Y7_9GAMM|nr:DM13 domain-containing protein [Ferrimonas marina]SHI05863.1 Electron transfer DM13 [Ferrimonas marina]
MNRLVLLFSHLAALLLGVALGIYFLPIWTAEAPPPATQLSELAQQAQYQGEFSRERQDSDALHWGEGVLSIRDGVVGFQGQLAPGPAYRLYLSPNFIETESAFLAQREQMVAVGEIRSFEGFMLTLPDGVDPAAYTTAVIWCEAFDQFISSASYQSGPG